MLLSVKKKGKVCKLTSTFPQVVKAVKMNKKPSPKTTTLKVLLSAMVLSKSTCELSCRWKRGAELQIRGRCAGEIHVNKVRLHKLFSYTLTRVTGVNDEKCGGHTLTVSHCYEGISLLSRQVRMTTCDLN